LNEVFKALSDPTRRRMLAMLRKRNHTAGELAEPFQMTKPSISRHLAVLKSAHLVDSEKVGRHVVYRLNTSVMQELLGWTMDFLQKEDE